MMGIEKWECRVLWIQNGGWIWEEIVEKIKMFKARCVKFPQNNKIIFNVAIPAAVRCASYYSPGKFDGYIKVVLDM